MSTKSAGESKKSEGFQLHKSPQIPAAGVIDSMEETESHSSGIDDLGELPRTYGFDTIFLVAQEPHWLFTYWDIDITRHPGGRSFLRVYEGLGNIEAEIEVPFETRNWYIPVAKAGASYTVEIGYYRAEIWNVIARSVSAQTPPESLSSSEQFDYATIPLHVSFQKLMESIKTVLAGGEPLAEALSRLQREGKFVGAESFPHLPPEQRILLEALLGRDFLENLSSENLASEEMERRIKARLHETLDSRGASELLSQVPMTRSDTSMFAVLGESGSWMSKPVSSWDTSTWSSWATAALTSWSGGGVEFSPMTTENFSSWSVPSQSSWAVPAQSSWTTAALSSWSQAAITSWSQAAVTSWSGGSETLSSFGVQQREFFMHVNAEVIFYGGTHPDAKVTIDGRPITLNPDGTFRYHFIFPNGAYEIPIVATSPDGVETRSATLRFERETEKSGHVTDTSQPPLDVPMGSRF